MPSGSEMIASHKLIMIEFIQMYKTMSYLWDQTNPRYQDRPLRVKAYKKLLKKYQEIDEEATMAILKGKLDNMRNSYIRELKKVRASIDTATDIDMVYSPVLWYYNLFSFLENHVLKRSYKRVEKDNGREFEYSYYDEVVEGSQSTTGYDHIDMLAEYLEDFEGNSDSDSEEIPHKRLKVESTSPKRDETRSQEDNDLDVIGKAIAIQLRDVVPHQAAIAQKLIAETVFYAKMGRLTEESTVSLN